MYKCVFQVRQHFAGADADRRGGEPGAGGRAGDDAAGPRQGEGLHHDHRDAGEGGQEGPGVLQQDQLLTLVTIGILTSMHKYIHTFIKLNFVLKLFKKN